MSDFRALPSNHVLKPLEERMLQMCDDLYPAIRPMGGNFVAALRVFAGQHPNLAESDSLPTTNDRVEVEEDDHCSDWTKDD